MASSTPNPHSIASFPHDSLDSRQGSGAPESDRNARPGGHADGGGAGAHSPFDLPETPGKQPTDKTYPGGG